MPIFSGFHQLTHYSQSSGLLKLFKHRPIKLSTKTLLKTQIIHNKNVTFLQNLNLSLIPLQIKTYINVTKHDRQHFVTQPAVKVYNLPYTSNLQVNLYTSNKKANACGKLLIK